MAEYIEREAAIAKCREIVACEWNHRASPVSWADAYEQFAEDIEEIQTADVAPVRHGYWRPILHKDGKADYECSCCLGIIMDVPDDDEHDLCAWCSMCGAKMDLEG